MRRITLSLLALALLAGALLAITGATWTPLHPIQIIALYPPANNTKPLYNDVQTWVAPNPLVSGFSIICKWSAIETVQGVYDFVNGCKPNYQNYLSFNKTIDLVFFTIDDPNGQNAIPAYVGTAAYAASLGAPTQDFCQCPTWPGDGHYGSACGNDGTTTFAMPAVWEVPFKTARNAFLKAAVQYANSQGFKVGSYIRPGYTAGGEMFPYCVAQFNTQFGAAPFKSAFLTGAADFASMLASTGSALPFEIGTNIGPGSDYTWTDAEAAALAQNHIGLACQGWQIADVVNAQGGGGLVTCDWVKNYGLYGQQVPVEELETLSESSWNSSCGSPPTGSLVNLAGFSSQYYYGNPSAIWSAEIFKEDLLFTLEPGYTDACSGGQVGPYVPYQQALANMATGSPAPAVWSIFRHAK